MMITITVFKKMLVVVGGIIYFLSSRTVLKNIFLLAKQYFFLRVTSFVCSVICSELFVKFYTLLENSPRRISKLFDGRIDLGHGSN